MKKLLTILIAAVILGFWWIHHDRIVAEKRAETKAANAANYQQYLDCLATADHKPGNQPTDYKGKENRKADVDECYELFESSQESINDQH